MRISSLMKENQLECHPDKTCFIVIGTKTFKEGVGKEVEAEPIRFGTFVTEEKLVDRYLGHFFHTDGLRASVQATVDQRAGKIRAAMFEIKGIMDDF